MNSSKRMSSKTQTATKLLIALLVVTTLVTAYSWASNSSDRSGVGSRRLSPDERFPSLDDGDPETPVYPTGWKTSLAEARKGVTFPVILPDEPEANDENLVELFRRPGGQESSAVFMIFPSPESPDSYIRQEFIEVDIEKWDGGDPRIEYQEFVVKAKAEGYVDEFKKIEGVPSIVVIAHSPADIERANPAFIRFVTSGVEIQISGGESLERLERIAASLIDRYRASG